MKCTSQESGSDDARYITGVLHFHSEYSHDGKNAINEIATRLKEDSIKFCVMTDHFEDFDEKTFNEFLADIESVNTDGKCILIPGVEIQFLNSHVLLFPVDNYGEIHRIVTQKSIPLNSLVKIIAHPTKNSISDLEVLSLEYGIDGIEIWNQQTDGNNIPSESFIREFSKAGLEGFSRFYFGCDVHNLAYQINNFIHLRAEGETEINADYIIERLRNGDFLNFNQRSKILLSGDVCLQDLLHCVSTVEKQAILYGRVLQMVKVVLKSFYGILPPQARRQLNDVKNTIKSRL